MFRSAFSIWGRDMLVMRRSIISELLAVTAYPLTLYLAFGVGLKGYIADVGGIPYPLFIAPGLISMTAVNAAFDESSWSMWFHRRVQRTIEEYRVTPITVYDIVIGKIISGFCQGAIKGVAVAVVISGFTGNSEQNKDVVRKFNRIPFKKINPYTAECEYFAGCVLAGCPPAVNGPDNALTIADVTDEDGNVTAKTDAVERAVQRALETLADRPRLPGEPQVVHDGGPQFVGHDWLQFMHAVGATDVPSQLVSGYIGRCDRHAQRTHNSTGRRMGRRGGVMHT